MEGDLSKLWIELKQMEITLDALMVGVLYIFLFYEIFFCLRQTITGDGSKKLNITTAKSARFRGSKFQLYGKFTGPLSSAFGSGRPTGSSSSRHFIQMRILGRRWTKLIQRILSVGLCRKRSFLYSFCSIDVCVHRLIHERRLDEFFSLYYGLLDSMYTPH